MFIRIFFYLPVDQGLGLVSNLFPKMLLQSQSAKGGQAYSNQHKLMFSESWSLKQETIVKHWDHCFSKDNNITWVSEVSILTIFPNEITGPRKNL